jgi:hypothetical protein
MGRRTLIGVAFAYLMLETLPASAQIAVHDAAVTARNRIAAALKELLLEVQREQHSKLRRMANRLSAHTNLDKYAVTEVPRWRTHDFETFLYANGYHAALNYGDATGTAYLAVTQPVMAARVLLNDRTAAAREALAARLATVEAADAAAIAATHNTGALRYNGRRELHAIDALQAHVIDPSLAQSATAVLDKISGAVLVGVRQRQARVQLMTGVVEQLLIDSKRERDSYASAINMQITTWRDADAANRAFAAGTGDALRTWRQP